MRYLIIANPISGKKKSISLLNELVIPILQQKNIHYKSFLTEFPSHASRIVNQYNFIENDKIIVLGGDGTMHEVINGMLTREDSANIPIGLLPAGSGNSLLHDLNQLNIKDTLSTILKNNTKKIDLLKIKMPSEEIFAINMIGWGMVNDIGAQAERMRWIGPMRYNISSIIQIFNYLPRNAMLTIDGELFNEKFAFIIVCNTIHVGKGMKMAPNASLDDGKMDIIIIKNNFSRLKLLQMFPTLFSGNHINSPLVKYMQAKSLELKPEKNEKLNIDGEMIGSTPISVDVIVKKIKLLN